MDLTADYAEAGFGGALGYGQRPALVVIDMAMAYFEPSSPLYAGVESVLEALIPLAAAARAAAIPVIFTRVEYAHPLDGGLFRRKIAALSCFEAGNPLGDFHPRLQPQPGDIVLTKQYPSAFFGTALAATLSAHRVDSLLISGLSTSGCVRATAVDSLCHGFIPLVVEDAVGDRSAEVHAANLFDLAAKTADLVPSADVIRRLGR
jgi:nicotinamidase-related amidase